MAGFWTRQGVLRPEFWDSPCDDSLEEGTGLEGPWGDSRERLESDEEGLAWGLGSGGQEEWTDLKAA